MLELIERLIAVKDSPIAEVMRIVCAHGLDATVRALFEEAHRVLECGHQARSAQIVLIWFSTTELDVQP